MNGCNNKKKSICLCFLLQTQTCIPLLFLRFCTIYKYAPADKYPQNTNRRSNQNSDHVSVYFLAAWPTLAFLVPRTFLQRLRFSLRCLRVCFTFRYRP